MFRYFCLLSALAMLVLACGAALAEDGKPGSAMGPGAVPDKNDDIMSAGDGRYQAMFDVLTDLTDEQKAKITAELKGLKRALDVPAYAKKKEALDKAFKEAQVAGNPETLQSIIKQRGALRQDNEKLLARFDDKIMAILTAEQASTWAASELFRLVTRGRKVDQLTEEQVAKIKELCAEASSAYAETDHGRKQEIFGALVRRIKDNGQLMTEADREADLKAKAEERKRVEAMLKPPTKEPDKPRKTVTPRPAAPKTQPVVQPPKPVVRPPVVVKKPPTVRPPVVCPPAGGG